MLTRLGDDREELGDLLAAPGEEVSPIDRRSGAEGLGHQPHPIQEVGLVHSARFVTSLTPKARVRVHRGVDGLRRPGPDQRLERLECGISFRHVP